MARRPKKGHRHEYVPPEEPVKPARSAAAKSRRGGVGQTLTGRAGLVTRLKFDTSHIVPIFRTELNAYQQEAWTLMGERRATLLLGPAGTAKTSSDYSAGGVLAIIPAVAGGARGGREKRLAELKATVPEIGPREAYARQQGGAALIDVREPEEIARAVVFLAGDDAGFVTGSTLSINGGQHMY